MNIPKVSVIIPVYNTAAYVEEAVRSLLTQTLHDLEIWIIDDGSTDESPSIVARLACEDARIHLYRQPNQGPSAARNAGISRATGQYIYFMDSDDLLEANTLELCYIKCENEHLDVVFFDADTFGADTTNCPWFDYHRSAAFAGRITTGQEVLTTMFDLKKYIVSPCLYLSRRALLAECNLSFYPGILHEDELFTTRLFLDAQRVGCIEQAFFKRRLRPNSIMSSRFSERNLAGYMTVFAQLQQQINRQDAGAKRLIGRYLCYTLNPVLRNAWALPWSVRWYTARTVVLHYFRYAKLSALMTLLVKALLKTTTNHG